MPTGSNSEKEYDVAIIGAGSAGYAAARTACRLNLHTALIEGGKEVGGLCILRGCMPTKALLYVSEVLHLAKKAPIWGISFNQIDCDYPRVLLRKDALIKEFADYRKKQLNEGPFDFIRAQSCFIDDHHLALSNGGTITARQFIIATGSIVPSTPLFNLKNTGYITSDTAIGLAELPRSMIVLGGGPVALEMAQLFSRFDVKVTLIQRSQHILKGFDTDVANALEKALIREGIQVYTDTKLIDTRKIGNKKVVTFEHKGHTEELEAQEILFAHGRIANTAGLGLDRIGVYTENGRILTNTEMQTTAPHVYAAGDCTGPHEIVHIAIQQGEIAAYNLSRPNRKKSMDYRLICSIVFTDPQIAQVGLTEKDCQINKIPYLAASYPFNDHGKSIIMDALDGFVKLLADPKSGEIIGGSVAGPIGGELIHEIITAMYNRMTVHELAAMPHYHPTLSEIWTYPAEELAEKLQ